MVMRIDDRRFGFENRFFALVKPIPPNRVRWPGLLLPVCASLPRGRRAAEGEWRIRVGSLIAPLTSGIRTPLPYLKLSWARRLRMRG
jgi:hypothetical protein